MAESTRLLQIQKLLADDPADPFLCYALAMEQLSIGEPATAAKTFQDLMRTAPDYVPTYLMLAQTLQKLGRDSDAATVLRDGIVAAQKSGDLHAMGELQGLLAIVE